jgi:hypothetical protein
MALSIIPLSILSTIDTRTHSYLSVLGYILEHKIPILKKTHPHKTYQVKKWYD